MENIFLTIISGIIGLLTGIAITIKIMNKQNNNRSEQKNNIVGGDMAGRDIKK